MKKILEPNYQMMLDSAITSLQQTYNDYKEKTIKNIDLTWIDQNGLFTVVSGLEERNEEIERLKKEITRLCFKVEELKQMVDMRKESE